MNISVAIVVESGVLLWILLLTHANSDVDCVVPLLQNHNMDHH